jgi:hypothetical protein
VPDYAVLTTSAWVGPSTFSDLFHYLPSADLFFAFNVDLVLTKPIHISQLSFFVDCVLRPALSSQLRRIYLACRQDV